MVLLVIFNTCMLSEDNQQFHKGLVTNYGEGGLQNGRGGPVKFYPYEKGGGGNSFSRAEGGAQQVLG